MSYNSCSVRFPKSIKSQHNAITLKGSSGYNTSFLGSEYSLFDRLDQHSPSGVDEDTVYVRDFPDDEKRSMIIDFAELNEVVDALQIADSLHLDVFEVNDIMEQLIQEGILKEL